MNLNRIIVIASIVVIVSIITWWAINSLEFAVVDKDYPPTFEARRDSWLAIERSLSPEPGAMRYKDASAIDLAHASVVAISAWDMISIDGERLAGWVASGGRLILMFVNLSEDEKPELPEKAPFIGLSPDYSEEYQDSSSDVTDKLGRGTQSLPSMPSRITVDMTVNFTTTREDATTSVYYISNERKAVVRLYGRGFVFACGAPLALYNDGLKLTGNRELAGFIFGPNEKPGLKVWLPARERIDNAVEKRLDSGPILLSAVFIFIMLFWMGGPRLGSIIPDEVQHRRSLRERFRAEGHFLWQHKAGNFMLGNPDQKNRLSKQAFVAAVNSIIKSERRGEKKHHDN